MIKRFGSVLFKNPILFSFSEGNKQHLMEISRELLKNYRTYEPWKNIRLIHQLTMAKYDPEVS